MRGWKNETTLAGLNRVIIVIDFVSKRNFMLRLLENPNLLEHDSFTEVIWAVFHLIEELAAREDIETKNEADFQHLVIDGERVYRLLTIAWLGYIVHLRKDYPYLYSLAVRMNPFDPKASPEIRV